MTDSNAGVSDSLEHALAAAVDQYGPSVLHDTARLRAALASSAPNSMPQIGALLAAVSQRIPHAMLAAADEDEMAGAMPALVERMMSLRTLKRDQAIWVVRTWANALAVSTRGLDPDKDEPAPDRPVPADTKSSVTEVLFGARHAAEEGASATASSSASVAKPPAVAETPAVPVTPVAKPPPVAPPLAAATPASRHEPPPPVDDGSLDTVVRGRDDPGLDDATVMMTSSEPSPAPVTSLPTAATRDAPPSGGSAPARSRSQADADAKKVASPAAKTASKPPPVEPSRLDPTLPMNNLDETVIYRPRRTREPDPDETILQTTPAWAAAPVAGKGTSRHDPMRTGVFPSLAPDEKPRDERRRGVPLMIIGAIAAIVVVGMVVWQRWSSSEPSEANVSTARVDEAKAPVPDKSPSAAPVPSSAAPAQGASSATKDSSSAAKDGGVQAPDNTTTAASPSKAGDGTVVASTTPTPTSSSSGPSSTGTSTNGASTNPTSPPISTPSASSASSASTNEPPASKAIPSTIPVPTSSAPARSTSAPPTSAPSTTTAAKTPPVATKAPPAPAKPSTASASNRATTSDKRDAPSEKAAPTPGCAPSTCGIIVSSLPSSEPGLFDMVIRLDDRSIQTFTYAIRIKAGARVRKSGSRFVVAN